MIELYTHPFSIVPWRISIALCEKAVPFKAINTNLYTAEPSVEFLEMNPFAQIPVIVDDGLVIAESIAILEYLEEKHPDPALLPAGLAERARARQLMCWCTDYWPAAWKQWMAPRLPTGLGDAWTEETVQKGRHAISAHLDVLERELGETPWLVGEFSLADVAYAPFVLVLERVDLGIEVAQRPRVDDWVERLKARPSIIETMMPPSG